MMNEFLRCLKTVRMLACHAGNTAKSMQSRGSEILVGAERVDSDTEFLILASTGIWEVTNKMHFSTQKKIKKNNIHFYVHIYFFTLL